MITEEEALSRILSSVSPLPARAVPLRQALGAFSLRPVLATLPLPGFDNSAMDGYAVRAADTLTRAPLAVIDAIAAGGTASTGLAPGTAIRIFTGAPMPPGADAVIMQEDVEATPDGKAISCTEPVMVGENVRLQGCDLCAGQRLLDAGDEITPARLAVLASQGLTHIEVASLARIAIITTGDELVPPGSPLPPGGIYNSNAAMLEGLVRLTLPAAEVTARHLRDDLDATISGLRSVIESHDAVIISGGVSVGEHDCVKPALKALGVAIGLWRVKVKPGKPVLFARTDGGARPCHIFGLPGNPVSSHVTFQLFVRPALRQMAGAGHRHLHLPRVRAVLGTALKNKGDRPHYLRGLLGDGAFTPTGVQQSHALFGLSQSNALLRMEPGQELPAGADIQVLLSA